MCKRRLTLRLPSVQMVWESGCVVVVMLTPLSENGVKQCHRYWPDEGSDIYHIYEVWQRAIEPHGGVSCSRCLKPALPPLPPPGQLGVGAHLVRGLPGSELLPEEPADQRDAHRHPVPLPVLDGPRDPQLGQDPAGLPQVRCSSPQQNPPPFQSSSLTAPPLAPRERFFCYCSLSTWACPPSPSSSTCDAALPGLALEGQIESIQDGD